MNNSTNRIFEILVTKNDIKKQNFSYIANELWLLDITRSLRTNNNFRFEICLDDEVTEDYSNQNFREFFIALNKNLPVIYNFGTDRTQEIFSLCVLYNAIDFNISNTRNNSNSSVFEIAENTVMSKPCA